MVEVGAGLLGAGDTGDDVGRRGEEGQEGSPSVHPSKSELIKTARYTTAPPCPPSSPAPPPPPASKSDK